MTPPAVVQRPLSDVISNDIGAEAGRLGGSVRGCLPWSGMSRIPRHYESFAAAHFRRIIRNRSVSWTDACPAYALGYLTHSAYGPDINAGEAAELEAQWEELCGTSEMEWSRALVIMQDAWFYLATRHSP